LGFKLALAGWIEIGCRSWAGKRGNLDKGF